MSAPDFIPGDIIVRRLADGSVGRRMTVQDPARTTRGKLRIKSDKATTVATTWWTLDWLPKGYELEGERERLVAALRRINLWGGYCEQPCKHPGHTTEVYRETLRRFKGQA